MRSGKKRANAANRMVAGSVGSNSSAASVAELNAAETVDIDKASCIGCVSVVSLDGSQPLSPFLGIKSKTPLPVLYHSDFCGHLTTLTGTVEQHQESPERVQMIFSRLCEDAIAMRHLKLYTSNEEVPIATASQLLDAHHADYVKFLLQLSHRYGAGLNLYPPEQDVLPLSPIAVSRLQPMEVRQEYFAAGRATSSGTRYSGGTLTAILRCAGAVVRAVHLVLSEETPATRAFCLIRPPGHHAGLMGFDPKAGGNGFCIINNVMIGVAEAFRMNGDLRVAIVDFDVHHGNGTEDIVRSRYENLKLLFCSIHLHETFPDDPDQDFFPGSGASCNDDSVLNVPILPLWCKPINDGAAQVAKETKKRRLNKQGNSVVTASEDPFPHHGDHVVREFEEPEVPRQGREAFRAALLTKIIPKLEEFKPDFLFLSSGFDGGEEDEGNLCDGSHGLNLTEADYSWATELLIKQSGAKYVVSVLEGGYGKYSNEANAYDLSPLVNCCVSHVAALVEKE